MYIEITPTDYIVSFRRQTDKPTAFNVDYHYSEDPDYQSGIIDFTQLKQDLVVTVSLENGVWTADHTWADMQQAIANGVLVRLTDATNDRYAIMGGYEDDKLIFVTNDTEYCYAYIVTDEDSWTMDIVLEGEDGVGIASVTFNDDYTLTITLTDGDSYTSQSLRGAQGPAGQDGEDGAQGPEGPEGPEGPQGVGIASTVLNADYTLTITLTNGNSYTTPSIRGAQGPAGQDGRDGVDGADGADGADGVGIASTVLNADYTLTITLTNGDSYTTSSIRGATGATGATGNGISAAVLNADYTLTLTFTDGTSYTTPSIRGAQGATGATGNGIASITLNADYTLTIVYTDGTSTTTTSIRGAQGEQGPAGPGVPTGGTAGQVLAKVDGTNYNTEWVTPSAPTVGTLDTTSATALPTSASESFGSNISLHKISKTGDYGDLLNKPTIPAAQVNSDWDAVSGVAEILNKPTIRDPKMYIGTCPTAAATVKKVVSVDTFPTDGNGKPLVGTMIGVKFTYTNSATAPTLNVNSTGDISIYYNNAVASSTSSNYGGSANRYNFYVYDGTYWVWVSYGTDANDNTIGYTIRTNGLRKTVSGACYRYRILFNSADGTRWVPANTSSSTNATSARTVNQTKIDPFGPIVYYSTTTALSSGGAPAASVLMQQYNGITLGYSFNRTGAALTLTSQKPVYIKCAPQTDGSAIIDADNPYVQDLPTTADGKIYILLGVATSATAIEMIFTHPVYYYKDGAIRQWTNAEAIGKLVTSISAASTDAQYPSAKCMWDLVGDVETLINAL